MCRITSTAVSVELSSPIALAVITLAIIIAFAINTMASIIAHAIIILVIAVIDYSDYYSACAPRLNPHRPSPPLPPEAPPTVGVDCPCVESLSCMSNHCYSMSNYCYPMSNQCYPMPNQCYSMSNYCHTCQIFVTRALRLDPMTHNNQYRLSMSKYRHGADVRSSIQPPPPRSS